MCPNALAIASGAEVMVTGDRDFEDLEALRFVKERESLGSDI